MEATQQSLDTKTKEYDEKLQDITNESKNQTMISQQINQERMKLQRMAENLSQLSHELVIKSRYVDEKIARAESLNSNIEQSKSMIVSERTSLQYERTGFVASIEEMNVMKMDIARQRVEYLKQKFRD